jgi:Domain of unknown function (DUF3482)/50S ribosome-binding GTPase
MTTVNLSLISHTNVGKTTLARTLLREDIGVVRDEAHVTEVSARFVLIETTEGDALQLWDTPGFGDSVRLLKRLQQSENGFGWFLSRVWDRFADRPFWSSQQAIRNVRDEADVVLYLVNAAEDPVAAGYVDPEMQILDWIGKPVLVLLNQLGAPRPADIEQVEVERWSAYVSHHAVVRDTLAFDAFARCWIQEHVLLECIASALPPDQQQGFDRLSDAWRKRNLATFGESMDVLAAQIASTTTDKEAIPTRKLGEKARAWLAGLASADARKDPAVEKAMRSLAERLDARVRDTTDELIALHGLSGKAAGQVLQRMGGEYAVREAADTGKASLWGGLVSGALGGLVADLAAGGLTFGAGVLIGGVLGAAGMRGVAKAYNLARGTDGTTVRWSPDFLTGRVVAAVMRYLAVSHFGRGRGDFVESEYPSHWQEIVTTVVARREQPLHDLWIEATKEEAETALIVRIAAEMTSITDAVLSELYPS